MNFYFTIFLSAALALPCQGGASPFCKTLIQSIATVAQKKDNTCGIACVRSVLSYWGRFDPGEEVLAQELGTDALGFTPPLNIVRALRARGLYASSEVGKSISDIYRFMASGETLIVSYYYGDVGHYSVVKMLDDQSIKLMDPWLARKFQSNTMSLQEFLGKWYFRRWYDGQFYFGHFIRVRALPHYLRSFT